MSDTPTERAAGTNAGLGRASALMAALTLAACGGGGVLALLGFIGSAALAT